jgi:tetratricopeptide (TPR) repeat protein
VRMGRRAEIELGLGILGLFVAVTLLFAMANVHRWQRSLTRGDARFQAAPPDQQSASTSGIPIPLARWQTPNGYTAGLTERMLGLRDDLALRHALALYRAANPNPNEQSQFNDDPELPAKRIKAQQALTAISKSDPDARIRSRATNMLGILARTGPTPVDPQQQRAQILTAIGLFRSAIKLDPDNADAKLNLELVLQDPQTELFVTGGAGSNPDAGTQGGTGSAGQGY